MPASIRNLPIVRSLASDTKVFKDGSTVFIEDRGIFGVIPPAEIAARAARSPARARHIRAVARRRAAHAIAEVRAAALSASNCPANVFCIYDFQNLQGEAHGLTGSNTGWQSLSACCGNFNDQAESMQNRRNFDSLLNRNYPATNGANERYCADSQSEDFDLGNNFGGNGRNKASAWANTPDNVHC